MILRHKRAKLLKERVATPVKKVEEEKSDTD
jgi:hypothetical protein